MNSKFTNTKKHFLVVGGTRGIGRVIVQMYAKENNIISVIGRKILSIDEKTTKNISYWKIDLSKPEKLSQAISSIVKKNGKISHLIFCQKYRGQKDWNGELTVSLTATKEIIEQTSNYFDQTYERSIVIISSVASSVVGTEQPVSYHVAKAGLNQLVRYFAVILGPKGIRVNSISPCTIIKEETKQFYQHHQRLKNLYKRIIPLKRMGTAEEIANIVKFLCSTDSSFVTGHNIVADGGLTLVSQEALARQLASLSHIPLKKRDDTISYDKK